MSAVVSDKLPPDVVALLNGEPALKAARIGRMRRGEETKADAKAYLDECREASKLRRSKLPGWQRELEDLLEFVPDQGSAEFKIQLALFLNVTARAVIVDWEKFAKEVIDQSGKVFDE